MANGLDTICIVVSKITYYMWYNITDLCFSGCGATLPSMLPEAPWDIHMAADASLLTCNRSSINLRVFLPNSAIRVVKAPLQWMHRHI